MPVTLKSGGTVITYDGVLLFMVKKNEDDADADAIIKKNITILHTNGNPYHGMVSFDLTDTSNPRGKYFCGFKTGDDGVWLPSKKKNLIITSAIVQGQSI